MNACRNKALRLLLLLVLLHSFCEVANANLFPAKSFQPYVANGHYPLWSKTWVKLERRVFVDESGIPYVNYDSGKSYNATTISLFGLLAYDRFLDTGASSDKEEFLRLANWIATHQDEARGCWCHDFDFTYRTLGETIHKPWISAMTQGLGISMMTRAYSMTHEPLYLRVAERGLLPFLRTVEQGGLARRFTLLDSSKDNRDGLFYEEYPTQPDPSYTLNGFMFSLLGLYDLAQVPNAQAQDLFRKGMQALRVSVPLYDIGYESAYDLGHLTRPPRPIHHDFDYHLVHITLLNALGSASADSTLLWYRDHWNSYGQPWEITALLLYHFSIWVLFRRTVFLLAAGSFLFMTLLWAGHAMWKSLQSRRALATRLAMSNAAVENRFARQEQSAESVDYQ